MTDKSTVLNLLRLPARLNAEQVAALLGFAIHDIPVLVRKGALQPLGKPLSNSPKWFAAAEVEQRSRDPKWLSKATTIIANHWAENNRRRGAAAEKVATREQGTNTELAA